MKTVDSNGVLSFVGGTLAEQPRFPGTRNGWEDVVFRQPKSLSLGKSGRPSNCTKRKPRPAMQLSVAARVAALRPSYRYIMAPTVPNDRALPQKIRWESMTTLENPWRCHTQDLRQRIQSNLDSGRWWKHQRLGRHRCWTVWSSAHGSSRLAPTECSGVNCS